MPSSIPVASFPASYPTATPLYDCVSDAPPLHSRRKGVVLRLEPASVDQSSRATCHDGNSNWPYSPILFRQTHPPHGSLFNKDDEGTVYSSHKDHRSTAPSSSIRTTKASIATLGLSLRSPAPKLDLLSVTALDTSRGYWDQHLPPRSSSLPTASPQNYQDMSKFRNSTPTLVDDDRCSESMTFAAPGPNGSGPSTKTSSLQRSASLSSASRDRRSNSPQSLASTLRTPAAAPKEQQPVRAHQMPYATDSLSTFPFANLSGMRGFAVPMLPPPPASKPKPKITVDTRSTSVDGKSSLLSLKRVKKLGHRGSISSLNASSPAESHPSNPSASTSSLLSSDSRSTGTPELDTVFDPTETMGSEEGTTMHVLVGTQWKRQDLHEVLPTLRSLKVSGRSGI